ncbi:MAG: beta-glucosidase [Ruminococcus sp.]|nr:beta-glucosidase [Ruminococcus sp.]
MKRTLDWNQYLSAASATVAEGIVMLKNKGNALPLAPDKEIAVFGRMQFHYYKSGTGSGGMVNVAKVTGILDGLLESGVKINAELLETYRNWDSAHPFDLGDGWGHEPWSQEEMPLTEDIVKSAAESCETAIVIIGRTAGEEQDNRLEEGSYLLSALEKDMLSKVRGAFQKMVVLLNTGNIIDMEDLECCAPDAILYVWQGGMTGGTGTADVLTGKVSPSGKLPDTIAYSVTDYPSDCCFGDKVKNYYHEDIYVGYRYFETFAKDRVRYPFGFGLSYTNFELKFISAEEQDGTVSFRISVRNTGNYSGKEVVQLYFEAPQGKLGNPLRVLCGYEKTETLAPNAVQELLINVKLSELASYDDAGVTGHAFCYVLESGDYRFYAGTDVRSAALVHTTTIPELRVVKQCVQAMAPVESFTRIHPVSTENGIACSEETVPLNNVDESARRLANLPCEIPYTGNKGIKLADVLMGTATMEEFIGQLSDYDLSCIIRGEGMGSPRVTPGTASAFGSVTDALAEFGIPCACCSDGPSGMRLDCGTHAFSLPNGTLIASTFNRKLAEELFSLTGLEMTANKVDCLLGPGMNIHRHPLNGRNFEYFSEDPYLTGTIAAAQLRGLHSAGVTGTIKHFCGNNQETNRHFLESVVSERALREIYLKGFEIAVREGNADSIMTTYGSVNGLWTAGNYDLNTEILRNEWGFTGFTMTDWWANINSREEEVTRNNFCAMARAQNDVYMVCADGGSHEDNTLEGLAIGKLYRCELQRNASNICRFLMRTNAMKRLMGEEVSVDILNRPQAENANDAPVIFHDLEEDLTLDLENVCTDKGSVHSFALVVNHTGFYHVTLTASSTQGELAQIPVTLFSMGSANGTFTWNGTGGKPVSFSTKIPMFSHYTAIRLFFAQSGLKMHSIRFEHAQEDVDVSKLNEDA